LLARAFFQKTQLRRGVQRGIPAGPPHAVDMADFSGQVEDYRAASNFIRQAGGVADVSRDDAHIVRRARNVLSVRAAARHP
jgi:hypothetical protein